MIEYIERLLQGAVVEWKRLGDISKNICSGGTPRSSVPEYYGGDIPWLRTQEVNFSEIWDTEVKITKEGLDSSNAKYIPANCIIVAMYGATVGRVGINKIPLTTNQACANIEVNEDIVYYKYLFYYLSSQYEYIKSLGAGTQTNINAGIVKNLIIPIPPLEVQREIVRILDRFTMLEAELEEKLGMELECRRKQYGYYRDKLLSEEYLSARGVVEWKTLGEVITLEKGKQLNKSLLKESGEYPAYNGGITYSGFTDMYNYSENKTIISQGGASAGFVNFITTKFYANAHCYVVVPNIDIVENKYVYYLLKMNQENLISRQLGAGIPSLHTEDILGIKIPIPPLSVQREVVRILDKFDTLTTSISEGLPREIELRRKQYEYYREQLLNFTIN